MVKGDAEGMDELDQSRRGVRSETSALFLGRLNLGVVGVLGVMTEKVSDQELGPFSPLARTR
jgi:hypothetical protein